MAFENITGKGKRWLAAGILAGAIAVGSFFYNVHRINKDYVDIHPRSEIFDVSYYGISFLSQRVQDEMLDSLVGLEKKIIREFEMGDGRSDKAFEFTNKIESILPETASFYVRHLEDEKSLRLSYSFYVPRCFKFETDGPEIITNSMLRKAYEFEMSRTQTHNLIDPFDSYRARFYMLNKDRGFIADKDEIDLGNLDIGDPSLAKVWEFYYDGYEDSDFLVTGGSFFLPDINGDDKVYDFYAADHPFDKFVPSHSRKIMLDLSVLGKYGSDDYELKHPVSDDYKIRSDIDKRLYLYSLDEERVFELEQKLVVDKDFDFFDIAIEKLLPKEFNGHVEYINAFRNSKIMFVYQMQLPGNDIMELKMPEDHLMNERAIYEAFVFEAKGMDKITMSYDEFKGHFLQLNQEKLLLDGSSIIEPKAEKGETYYPRGLFGKKPTPLYRKEKVDNSEDLYIIEKSLYVPDINKDGDVLDLREFAKPIALSSYYKKKKYMVREISDWVLDR